MANTKRVTQPVLELKQASSTFRLWALNVGEWVQLSPASCHYFRAEKTASLIYESITPSGHSALEVGLRDENTWAWIAENISDDFTVQSIHTVK